MIVRQPWIYLTFGRAVFITRPAECGAIMGVDGEPLAPEMLDKIIAQRAADLFTRTAMGNA